MPERFTGTHISGPFNSTEFTDCCGVAAIKNPPWIKDDVRCPRCGATVMFRVVPYSSTCRMCGKPRSQCYC